jgi:hypothetical protein
MNFRRFALIAFALIILLPIAVEALQSQRAQLGITIIINVTPNPLGYVQAPGASQVGGIIAKARLRGAPAKIERTFEAQQLHFTPLSTGRMVAVGPQHSLRVEAEVTPNPTATLLTTDAGGSTVTLSAEAGVPTVFSCVYHVTVQTTVSGWQLKHGLSNDFSNAGGQSFVGGSVANNSYVTPGTPMPTATPFVVYQTNGGTWAVLQVNSATKTYCVDLTVNMPIATPQGQFASNAIYTLYY